MRQCPSCGFWSSQTRYFCQKCGKPFQSDQFSQELYGKQALKIQRVNQNIDLVPHNTIPWDKKIDDCIREIEKIEALFSLPSIRDKMSDDLLKEKINSFYEICHNPYFQIAFVGTIKTGKSTLINALLGRNYASMAVTPETAALTKFRSSPKDYVKVTFYSREEWKKLWASRSESSTFEREFYSLKADKVMDNWLGQKPYEKELANADIEKELVRWSSSQYPEHFFVKEIEVGIYTLTGVPPQVVFVDTPGLLDTVAYRSEITRSYIRRANAVFVCVDAQKIQAPEIETISSVFSFASNKKDKVYIIATHWDKLNNPVSDWRKQRAFFARQLTGPAFYPEEREAESHILHAAAYLYNLCREFPNISRRDQRALEYFAEVMLDKRIHDVREYLSFIREKTNILAIQEIIREDLAQNYQKLLNTEIQNPYRDIIHDVNRIVDETMRDLVALSDTSDKGIDQLKAELAEKEKDRAIINEVSRQLEAHMEKMEYESDKILEDVRARLKLAPKSGKKNYSGAKKSKR